jgi:very-short-patch-repair endonuclease
MPRRSSGTASALAAWAAINFVRQEPIGPYVVDFVCRERRLVVEVDGGQHATDTRDVVRDQWLTDHRYRVLRFWNIDVLRNMDGVLETIALTLEGKGDPRASETRST